MMIRSSSRRLLNWKMISLQGLCEERAGTILVKEKSKPTSMRGRKPITSKLRAISRHWKKKRNVFLVTISKLILIFLTFLKLTKYF